MVEDNGLSSKTTHTSYHVPSNKTSLCIKNAEPYTMSHTTRLTLIFVMDKKEHVTAEPLG